MRIPRWPRAMLRRGGQLIGVVCLALLLFPVYWLMVTAFTPVNELLNLPPTLYPNLGELSAFEHLFAQADFLRWMRNSATIAFGTAAVAVLFAAFAGYAMSRYKFRGRGTFGFILFATQMLPTALLIVPLYGLFITLGLLNNLGGVILADASFVLPICVWLLKGAFDAIPVELEESAKLEGLSVLQLQTQILWPLAAPSLAAVTIIAFFFGWDEFIFANTFLTDPDQRPASVGLASLVGQYTVRFNDIMAGAAVYALPGVVFFVLAQRYVVAGLTAGSVKG